MNAVGIATWTGTVILLLLAPLIPLFEVGIGDVRDVALGGSISPIIRANTTRIFFRGLTRDTYVGEIALVGDGTSLRTLANASAGTLVATGPIGHPKKWAQRWPNTTEWIEWSSLSSVPHTNRIIGLIRILLISSAVFVGYSGCCWIFMLWIGEKESFPLFLRGSMALSSVIAFSLTMGATMDFVAEIHSIASENDIITSCGNCSVCPRFYCWDQVEPSQVVWCRPSTAWFLLLVVSFLLFVHSVVVIVVIRKGKKPIVSLEDVEMSHTSVDAMNSAQQLISSGIEEEEDFELEGAIEPLPQKKEEEEEKDDSSNSGASLERHDAMARAKFGDV